MKDFVINEVECKTAGSGGLFPSYVGVEAVVQDKNGKKKYVSMVDYTELLEVYESNKSLLDILIDEDLTEEEHDKLENYKVFECIFSDINDLLELQETPLYKYLLYLLRADWDKYTDFVDKTKGKNVNSLEIPTSDVVEIGLKMKEHFNF